jgi:hypothetical protein
VRIPRCAIVVVIVSAVCITGCGGGNEVESVPFKQTDTTPFKGMLEQQAKGLAGAKNAKPIPK